MRSVPYERPEEMGGRVELTPEEFAARAKSDAEQLDDAVNEQTFSAASRSASARSDTRRW